MSERVYEPYDTGVVGFAWHRQPDAAVPAHYLPPALYDVMPGVSTATTLAAYPTREAALAALDAARAAAEKTDPPCGILSVVPMPIDADGRGPETDPAKVVRTGHEVWDEACRSLGVLTAADARLWRAGTAAAELAAACEATIRAWKAFEYDEAGVPQFDSMNRFRQARDECEFALSRYRGATS